MADDLYDRDYYAWTQVQASALRARKAGQNELDFDNLAEEVEDLGRSQRRACESQIDNIITHLLKIAYQGGVDVPHWRGEIAAFRKELRRDLSPSLSSALPTELPAFYDDVLRVLRAKPESADWAQRPPPECPFSWDDLLGRGADWTPEAWSDGPPA